MRLFIGIVFFNIVFTSPIWSQIQEHTLSNGLKVVVKEDHRAPIVVSMVWYNVGSADEPRSKYGVSHALEHLLFKGTPKYPHGHFARTVSSLGGEFNALTNSDYTLFYEKAASTHLPTLFDLEADRMEHLLWDEREFRNEMNVIQEERRLRVEDNPQALGLEQFLAAAHLSQPYQHPVIGWMANLRRMNMKDAKTWYQTYYAPNNAVLVVVGDVKTPQVFQWAEHYFNHLKSHAIPSHLSQHEPEHLSKKQIQIKSSSNMPVLIMGYTTPTIPSSLASSSSHDPYVLDVIAGILGMENSGRFSKRLEQELNIANTSSVYYNPYARHETQFAFFGIPNQQNTLNTLEHAIINEIKELQSHPVTSKELERIKTQIIAQKTFEKDSIFNQGMEIGMLETLGIGWQEGDRYVNQVQAVTPEQIQAVAQRYFQDKNLTITRLK